MNQQHRRPGQFVCGRQFPAATPADRGLQEMLLWSTGANGTFLIGRFSLEHHDGTARRVSVGLAQAVEHRRA